MNHIHEPTHLYDCEALRKSKALKALSTELYIVKDLAVHRLIKEGRRKGPDMSFDFLTDMGRTVRVGKPRSGHVEKSNTKNFYLKIRLGSDSELNGSSIFTHLTQWVNSLVI